MHGTRFGAHARRGWQAHVGFQNPEPRTQNDVPHFRAPMHDRLFGDDRKRRIRPSRSDSPTLDDEFERLCLAGPWLGGFGWRSGWSPWAGSAAGCLIFFARRGRVATLSLWVRQCTAVPVTQKPMPSLTSACFRTTGPALTCMQPDVALQSGGVCQH